MKDQVLIQNDKVEQKALVDVLRQACKKVAPVWPLENFVAVNPYLGLTGQKFESAASTLAMAGGIQMTLPTSFYLTKIKEGKITLEDIGSALSKKFSREAEAEEFLNEVIKGEQVDQHLATVETLIDVASRITEKDWSRFVTSRISVWAASYFDNGQAIWSAANQGDGLFAAWKAEATIDRTPELAGIKNFRQAVRSLPDDPMIAVQKALEILEVKESDLPLYLHRLLLKQGGWAAYAARLDWDSELYGGKDGKLIELLAVLISWEACLFRCMDSPKLRVKWIGAKRRLSDAGFKEPINQQLAKKLILQEAFDLATQRDLISKFKNEKTIDGKKESKVKAQAIFCIDVRSEVFRRNLEQVDREIETIGFAGFFAFPIKYVPIGHAHGEAQCPVLIKTGPTILEEMGDEQQNWMVYKTRLLRHRINKLWKSFRTGAITCFSFVSPLGLSYLPKLFTDSFGLTRPVPHPDNAGLRRKASSRKKISLKVETHNHETVGIPIQQQVQMAKNALQAMSLTNSFGSFVLIVGHGSTTVNNPYATGLDCGACGGHTGEANARVAAAILNDKSVRGLLKEEGISIPDNTVFLACLHDTTTDEISVFNEQDVHESQKKEFIELKKSLAQAGQATRTERALRMSINKNTDAAIKSRSTDWSQVRPEWGLAGCSAFVVAPRERTKNLDLGGRSFLHTYKWREDRGFSVLELIMTAPMVVTSWINLQYYASTVDNKYYGSGNKTLHNVTSGVGVLEGFSGDLRVGLPIQSVHDGEKFQHEPVKLNVIIEAPLEAMNMILKKHQSVRDLCDNGWIHLLAMNGEGQVSHRYGGNFHWEAI